MEDERILIYFIVKDGYVVLLLEILFNKSLISKLVVRNYGGVHGFI